MSCEDHRWSSHHCVHVGLSPDDVMVVVDDHGPAQNMQVLHDVLLDVCQRGDVCVVTCSHTHTHTHTHTQDRKSVVEGKRLITI